MSVSREQLVERLRDRRVEIEQALLTRIASVNGAEAVEDPEYREGFRSVISAAFDFSLAAIKSQMGEVPPFPAELLSQARLAARHRVGLDTVLRGYVAGATLIDDFILNECDHDTIQVVLRSRAVALEDLLSQVSVEYEQTRQARASSREARTLELIKKLLRGGPQVHPDLDHDLGLNHVGLVARGVGAQELLDRVHGSVDCRPLVVRADTGAVWAWLSRRSPIHSEEVLRSIGPSAGTFSVGIGESARGVTGWRQTHRQAKAALPVALRSDTQVARYADVCLLASAMQDDLLRSSLHALYLKPLLAAPNGQQTYIETLRAYFATSRNGASAASSLGVSRQTVINRLRAVEERLGCSLARCASAVELAVDMNDLGQGEAGPGEALLPSETRRNSSGGY